MKKAFSTLLTAIYCATCLISLGEEQKPTPETALIQAARKGDVAEMKTLLDQGVNIDATDRFAETALMNAADQGKLEALKELLARRAKIDLLNKDNRSAFFFASLMGHEDAALALLKAGAAFDVPDKDGKTPLMAATQKNLPALVGALLERGAKADASCRWGNALLYAAGDANNAAMAAQLMAHGANVNRSGETSEGDLGWTPLHFAALKGNLEMAQLLLTAGGDINAVREGGRTPLMEAAEYAGATEQSLVNAWWLVYTKSIGRGYEQATGQSLAMVSFLVQAGADINAEDAHGDTALTIAGQKGRTPIVDFLIQNGAKKKTFCVNVSPYPVQQPLPPEKRWALAATALLTQLNRESHEMLGSTPLSRRQNARNLLRYWYHVNNHHDAVETLGWLKNEGHRMRYASTHAIDPDRLLGWDYCRVIFVAGKAYVAGYLSEDQAWDIILPTALKLQKTYPSWKELGESYLFGRSIWKSGDQSEMRAVFDLLLNPNDPNSPWNINDWNTPLDGNKPSGGEPKPRQNAGVHTISYIF